MNKDQKQPLKPEPSIISSTMGSAYMHLFERIAKHYLGKTYWDTVSDCMYVPIYPAWFVEAFYVATHMLLKEDSKSTVNFIDLGCGPGNNLFLARDVLQRIPIIGQVTGIELEPRFIRGLQDLTEGMMDVKILYGDMTEIPLGIYNIVHFFNSLVRNTQKELAMYQSFCKDLKEGSLLLLSSSRIPDLKYFNVVYEDRANCSTAIYRRNNVVYPSKVNGEIRRWKTRNC